MKFHGDARLVANEADGYLSLNTSWSGAGLVIVSTAAYARAGAGVCEPPPVAFGEHAAGASAKVSESAATRRYVTTRTTPSARTLAHALPTDDLFVEFNELRCDVGPVVLGSPPRPRFAEALPQAGIADQPLEGVGEGLGALWLDEEAGDISLYDTLVPVDIARDDREPGRHRLE